MLTDFTVNILASVAFLVMGFVGRQLLVRYRTRATRSLWRSSLKNGLIIAITTRPGDAPSSGTRASFREVRTLIELVPTFSRLRIRYDVIESFVDRARQIADRDILLLGGPNSNELTKAALDLLGTKVVLETTADPPSAKLFNRYYGLHYSTDGQRIEETYGLVIRINNPFSSNPNLTATLVMGLTGLGTRGAARLLVDEHLAKQLLARDPHHNFAAGVRVRPIGDESVVTLEEVWRL
jgi:hypothetical protein